MGHQSVQHPLMEVQRLLLSRGPNLAVVPKYLQKGEYVAAVEDVCLRPPHKTTLGLRTDTYNLLIKVHPPGSILPYRN